MNFLIEARNKYSEHSYIVYVSVSRIESIKIALANNAYRGGKYKNFIVPIYDGVPKYEEAILCSSIKEDEFEALKWCQTIPKLKDVFEE